MPANPAGRRASNWRLGLAGAVLAGALLLLVACAPSGGPTPGAGSAAPAATAAAPIEPAHAPLAAEGGSTAPADQQPIRLTVNWSQPSGSQTGLWMAYEGGYFREQGLDVELVNIGSTSPTLQAMVAGEVQLSSLDPATTIQASLGGADVVLLYGMVNRLVFSIMTQPSIQQPDALRGKTLGVGRFGSSGHTAIRVALAGWGLALERDVSLRQMGTVPAILSGMQAGQLDGGSLSPPTNGLARQAGFHELVDLSTQGPEYPSLAVGGLRAWAAANDEAVRRFGRAYVRGTQRFKADRAFALEVYRKYLQTADTALLEETYAQFLDLLPDLPIVSEVGMASILEDLARDDPRLAGRQPSEWVDSRYARELSTH